MHIKFLIITLFLCITYHFLSAQENSFYVKDTKHYDSTFIAIQQSIHKDTKLIDSFIIRGNDTIAIPLVLKPSSMHTFYTTQNNEKWKLVITKLSHTLIRYTLIIRDNDGKMIEGIRGIAALDPYFSSNTLNEVINGTKLSSFEYIDITQDCTTKIRIAYELNADSKIQSRISISCKDPKRKIINFKNCPILVSENKYK